MIERHEIGFSETFYFRLSVILSCFAETSIKDALKVCVFYPYSVNFMVYLRTRHVLNVGDLNL